MAELNKIEKDVAKAMNALGANKADSIKTADDIAKRCNRPKSMVTNTLTSLTQKGVAKRVAREKSAGYYLTQDVSV